MTDVTIDAAELAELREKAAQAAQPAPEPEPAEGLVTHRALLADGTTYDYTGAHPTHVTREGPDGAEQRVPVLAVYPA